MVRRTNVTVEQGSSLAAKLVEAGHEHGDESELHLAGVGVTAEGKNVHLQFCPATIVSCRALQHGSKEERRQPMPKDVKVSHGSVRRLRKRFQRFHFQGFADISCRIHSNGMLHVKELHVTRTERYNDCVNWSGAYEEYQASLAPAAT